MTIPRHPTLLDRDTTALLVVDMQDAFLRVIHESQRVVENVKLLVQAASILSTPVIVTTQNSTRLGGTTPELLNLFSEVTPTIDKLTFSAVANTGLLERLQSTGRSQIVICGIETHICVTQTALDLLVHGFQVHVVPDAVSSRTLEKHKLGMERLRDNGVYPVCAEAAVYELLKEAGSPEFRQILPLVK